jgi:hypothetical protein
MDIMTLLTASMVGRLDALILYKRDRILYLERFLTVGSLHLKSLNIGLILLDYTREGFPVLEFIYAGGV